LLTLRDRLSTRTRSAFPPFGADIALMPSGIWLAHIRIFGAENRTAPLPESDNLDLRKPT
jgi:hypothetical protein